MQTISQYFTKILADKIKVGQSKKPMCRIEVDRFSFIPGAVSDIKFLSSESCARMLDSSWNNGSYTYSTNHSGIVYPVQGRTLQVNSYFGWRTLRGKSNYHTGIDLYGETGDPLVAAWPGTVNWAGNNGSGYGNYVKIDHGDGTETLYCHMSEIIASTGQYVNAGDVIGKVGSTGNSTGPHLHFEIRLNGEYQDPLPYFEGSAQKDFTSNAPPDANNTNQIIPGAVIVDENFLSNLWFGSSNYEVPDSFKLISFTYSDAQNSIIRSRLRTSFQEGKTAAGTYNFKIKPIMKNTGFIDLSFSSNFDNSAGDSFALSINGTDISVTSFDGLDKEQYMKSIALPAGTPVIEVKITYGGQGNKVFDINHIKIQEAEITGATGTPQTLGDYFNNSTETVTLSTGRFVYMDTLQLDNIESCNVSLDFEKEAGEADITISNINGYFSPDYNPFNFAELYQESPWSYFIDGFQMGVLSDNTPIRIFMGYGDEVMRVFTGLIDKVDIDGDNATMSISCRDMYKRIVEKVITEPKSYGSVNVFGGTSSTTYAGQMDLTGDRAQDILKAAQTAANEYGVDYRFLMAICQHETSLGTAGAGRISEGSYILGYGLGDSRYKGVETQMHYGAKRIYDIFVQGDGSVKPVTSLADVQFFNSGGNIGLPWCTDGTDWPGMVWAIYSPMIGQGDGGGGTQWLLSAAVHDLANHAKLSGWRGNEIDMNYPDIVIEETYLIETNQATGKIIRAVPDQEGVFEEVDISSSPTIWGWMNPFVVAADTRFEPFKYTVSDAINSLIKDTNLWSRCDRYGTYRLDEYNYKGPVVEEYNNNENLVTISKTIDFSRGRSHLVVQCETVSGGSGTANENFVDKELLLELKGELRTAVMNVPWAKTSALRKKVAEKFFFDIKRICRTIQVVVPGNPALDLMDRVRIVDKNTATSDVYIVKAIKHQFSSSDGYTMTLDLMWCADRTVI